jgi:hypothetical protein
MQIADAMSFVDRLDEVCCMKICPNDHSVPDSAKFCTTCGAPVAASRRPAIAKRNQRDYQDPNRDPSRQCAAGRQYDQQPRQEPYAYRQAASSPEGRFRGKTRSPVSVIILTAIN